MGVLLVILAVLTSLVSLVVTVALLLVLEVGWCKRRYVRWQTQRWPRPVLRTPDERFEGLPDFPFAANYVEVEGLRVHYVDEGARDGKVVLLMHGEPSWSYLYRKMIPPLVAKGFRVIAPDLVGFGKSDKLEKQCDYTYQMHVDVIRAFVEALDLREITLFCQDWGGLVGLRVALDLEGRFARIVASNTGIPGKPPRGAFQPVTELKSKGLPRGFITWYCYSQLVPDLKMGKVLQLASRMKLSAAEMAAYDAPFPSRRYKAGARKFPRLVPSEFAVSTEAWERYARWDKPFLTAFSSGDPITRGIDRAMQRVIPGAQGQAHCIVRGAGHFVQEDKGPELAEIIVEFVAKN